METLYVASDLHIGSPRSLAHLFRRCPVDGSTLVVAGDVFEDEHRVVGFDEFAKLVKRFLVVIGVKPREVFMALSSSSHDPILPRPFTSVIDGVRVFACNCAVRVGSVVAVHGDSVIRNGALAYLVERFRRGLIGEVLRRRLGLSGEWLVYGHTHIPLVDRGRRLVNPGPWKVYGFRRLLGGVVELPSAETVCGPAQHLAVRRGAP